MFFCRDSRRQGRLSDIFFMSALCTVLVLMHEQLYQAPNTFEVCRDAEGIGPE